MVLGLEGKCETVINQESRLPKISPGKRRPCCKKKKIGGASTSLSSTGPNSCRCAMIFFFNELMSNFR